VNALIVFDEGPGVGLGHRRRCEGLAHALRPLGVDAELRVLDDEPVVGEVVLVDSYRIRADDESRFAAEAVIAIDDIERDLAVDLVIDPDPGADARVHKQAEIVLAGAPYALVDPDLRTLRTSGITGDVRTVLVTAGAADSEGFAARVASQLADELPGTQIRLVVGPWGRDSGDDRVTLVHAPDGLGLELAAADLVVTAGGVTMLESCCLGRPTVAFSIADNQARSLAGAARVGAVVATDVASAASLAARLAKDADSRLLRAMSAQALIDGQGAARVAAVIATMSRHGIHAR
jgi:spore coat polysaccharide biosynthesis predicted glycosyltransferase SpsG